MKKKIGTILLLSILCIGLTGCFKRDVLEDITIYTTSYPMEYITNRLYGTHSTVSSVYPDGVDPRNYKLTDKQIKDYSKGSMFIFNGLVENEKKDVIKMFKENKNIKIIDTTLSMEYTNEIEDLWLNPSNFLMLSQNIKNGLNEYISNHYLKEEINQNYDALKLEISSLDAKFKLVSESANRKTIVVSNDVFKFLEKYNFNVISLEENANLTQKTVSDVQKMIRLGTIKNIFVLDNEEVNGTVQKLIKNTEVPTLTFHTISNLDDASRKENKDYISLMNNNIELLKQELYD
ncbi:MAG: metal ABC transporter substrate-binding protein [Bacilli bacterium]|nr:metal ABC transporter substrate-binding protein [Bacilli bacterium]